ncbi:hypothetical protein N0V88_006281 [Collariella sp. IMI 366227]|nr:hypothetical protein N0V88_006281 [Collariella sp. IMI 366227]
MAAFFHKHKPLHQERSKRRVHPIVPWIENPLQGVDKEHLVFAPRHEASTLELFFDLFFVANLATFTTYQYIVNHSTLFAYIGFFAIIWVSWFHTVLHDNLFLPVFLNAFVYLVAVGGYAGMLPAFAATRPVETKNGIYSVWWIIMALESIATIAISSFWRMLSFKKTHLVERMGLLTLIVIGEGAIGVTKTISRLMGKTGIDPEGCGLILCIVLILVNNPWAHGYFWKHFTDQQQIGAWMLYFDYQPRRHFGTIKQQIWSCLHFPIHLAIVGMVEGAQQIALARYVESHFAAFEITLEQYCFKDHLDGEALATQLSTTVAHLHLDKKLNSLIFMNSIQADIDLIGTTKGICGPRITGPELPQLFLDLAAKVAAAMYSGLGVSVPLDQNILMVMLDSWKLVYRYFWAAFVVLVGCYLIILALTRTTKIDAFDYVAFLDRTIVILIASALLGLSASHDIMYNLMSTPAILPISVALLYLIIIVDRFGAWFANRRNKRSGDELLKEENGHGHGHGHKEGAGSQHELDKQRLIVSSVAVLPTPEEVPEPQYMRFEPYRPYTDRTAE